MDGLTCIKQFEIREDYYYAGVKVVSCHIFYPQFIGHHPALDALNNKYYLQAIKKKDNCTNVLYPDAVQALLQGSKAFPYEMIVTITLTLQTNEIASFYQQEYLYTGGANGQTTRIGQTINTLTGEVKHLCDFLQNKKTFHPQNFYLTSEGVVVFFALYDIAPHSTGIPTFLIPYSQC